MLWFMGAYFKITFCMVTVILHHFHTIKLPKKQNLNGNSDIFGKFWECKTSLSSRFGHQVGPLEYLNQGRQERYSGLFSDGQKTQIQMKLE